MRTLEALIDRRDPALPLLRQWIADPAGNGGELLPVDEALRADTLLDLQVTTRSMLGTLAYETGGVSIADGMIRLFGSGAGRTLRGTAAMIGCPLASGPDVITVGDDIFGGLYALDGGRFGGDRRGGIYHLAADDILWRPLGCGFSAFVAWCCTGEHDDLYRSILPREPPSARPHFGSVWSFVPFLWTREAKEAQPSVRAIDADEGLRLRIDLHGFATA